MQTPTTAEIEQLLRRITARDQAAFRTLYDLFARRVYAFLVHRFSHREAMAEEVVSDTLLHVWKSPTSFRGESAFATWLIGVARFKMLERLRSEEPVADDIDAIDEGMLVDPTRPDDVAALRQRSDGVRACLDRLPADQRECMHLAYYEGWTLDEIGAHLRAKRETIGTRIFYARKKIQACLAALLASEREAVEGVR